MHKEYKGAIVRDGNPTDKNMVSQCLKHYDKFDLDSESVVMDMGTHIGGFASMCKTANVKEYIGFEPDNGNYAMLQLNSEGLNRTLYNGAISTLADGNYDFYQTNSQQYECSGTIQPLRKSCRKQVTHVTNYNIHRMLDLHKPTHIKCDIEGSEFDWLSEIDYTFPSYVEQISFELHGGTRTMDVDNNFHKLTDGFTMVHMNPAIRTTKSPTIPMVFPNFGFTVNGTLWGVDILLKRSL